MSVDSRRQRHSHHGGSFQPDVVPAGRGGGSSALEPRPRAELLRLWQEHQRELLVLCSSVMRGSRMDAEDALGRALLVALEKFERYEHEIENSWAWLRRLVFNTCISILRERQRERRVVLPDLEESAEVPSLENPEQLFLRRELGHRLKDQLESLPERLQEPVKMRLVLGLEYSEIAGRLSISEENARKRVQLGREELRRRLTRYMAGQRR